MSDKDRSLSRKLEIPSEALSVIGREQWVTLREEPLKWNAVMGGLEKKYKENGLQWILDHKEYLRDMIQEVVMF